MATQAMDDDDKLINCDPANQDHGLPHSDTESTSDPGSPRAPEDLPEVKIYSKPTRLITVEPTLILFFSSVLPTLLLCQQFVYTVVSVQHNMTHLTTGEAANESGTSESCGGNGTSDAGSIQNTVQSRSALWLMCLNLSTATPAVFMVVIYGTVSDKLSRKLPLVLPIVGQIVKCLIFIITLHFRFNLYFLFVGCLIEGFTGGLPTMMMATMAYMADVHDHSKRTFRITILEVFCGVMAALATITVGYLIILLGGYMPPFIIILGVHIFNLMYTVFLLPELRRAKPGSRKIKLKQVINNFRMFGHADLTGRRWQRGVLVLALVFCDTVMVGRWDTVTLYMLNVPLCFSPVLLGYATAGTNIISQLGGLLLVMVAHRCLRDVGVAMVGCLSGIAYALCLAFSSQMWHIFLAAGLGFATVVPATMLRVIMSKLTAAEEQGALFSVLSGAEGICSLFGSLVFNPIYSATLGFFEGFVFLVMALFIFLGLCHISGFAIFSGQLKDRVLNQETVSREPEVPGCYQPVQTETSDEDNPALVRKAVIQ